LCKIKQLPKDTKIYCGHEYTLANVIFALSIDPNNKKLQHYSKWVSHQEKELRPTIPTMLSDQLLYNPFLRCDEDQFMKLYESQNAIEVFAKIRSAKDNF
jgi:hydroxyacylglutathione hydrolase